MRKIVLIMLMIVTAGQLSAQSGLVLAVTKKQNDVASRYAKFIPVNTLRQRKNVPRNNPGAGGHLTVLVSDRLLIEGENDSMQRLLESPGNFIFSFENAESLDSMPYVSLLKDSISAISFRNKMERIKKREWEVYRIVVTDKHSDESYCVYIRFQNDLFTIDLPDKSNREAMKFKSISPSIPIIHLGSIDYTNYQVGPGVSFNVGLMPRRPYMRLLSDIVGPVSLEWMFKPINNLNDAFAIQSAAVGVFFNSFYGLFHWGIAWYTLTYCRAEAYIGINFAPAMQLFNGRKTWRYRW